MYFWTQVIFPRDFSERKLFFEKAQIFPGRLLVRRDFSSDTAAK
jgi:hypothetical protein